MGLWLKLKAYENQGDLRKSNRFMKYPLWNQKGEKIKEVTLPKEVFEQEMNEDLVHQAVTVEQANQRIPIAHTKTRGEVSGSGVKPWRQKGTGRARAGSVRSPIWRGGGIVFGPRKDRDFHKKINQKMKQKALAIVLSSKIRDKELKIIDALSLKEPKTKLMAGILEKMGLGESTLILAGQVNMNLIQACRNLPKIEVRLAQQVTPLNILQFKNLLITEPTIKILEGRL